MERNQSGIWWFEEAANRKTFQLWVELGGIWHCGFGWEINILQGLDCVLGLHRQIQIRIRPSVDPSDPSIQNPDPSDQSVSHGPD
uniref:Uncharacterized protein n=1 Tax=Sphaerodactylus townsendi TaxID=933632 RepID=A0ACB8FSW6_9SAUR